MSAPLTRAVFHGKGEPDDEKRLFTRTELPAWVKPDEHHESNVSYFYGVPNAPEISQAVFSIDADGATFLDLTTHTSKTKRKLGAGDLACLPGCVLIAVGVEQLRRARAGR